MNECMYVYMERERERKRERKKETFEKIYLKEEGTE
jgi:hypothetical protein